MDMRSFRVFITPKILLCIKRTFVFGNFVGLHPCAWNDEYERVEIGPRGQQIKWWVNMCITFPCIAFVLCRGLEHATDEEYPPLERIYLQFMLVLYFLGITVHWMALACRENVVNYVNRAIRWAKYLMQITYCFLGVSAPPLALGVILYKIESPDQLASLVVRGRSSSLGITEICAVILGLSINLHSLVLILASVLLLLMSALAGGIPVLLTIFEQTLRIVMIFWNSVFGSLIVPVFKFLAFVLIVLSVYGGIRMQGVQALAMGLLGSFMLFFLIVGFSILAEIDSHSHRLIQEWKTEVTPETMRSNWFQLTLKSLPNLKCIIGTMYFVDKPMILTMVSGLVDEIVSFLIVNS